MIAAGKKIGVDAGASLVKIIELVKSGAGMALEKWSFMPFRVPKDSPPEALIQVQAKAINAAINKCECKCRDIVVGVPGNSAFIRNIKLPPVPPSKIDQIVRYEIQQTIPFPIENIALDYQVLDPDESSEVEVIMVAMKGEAAETFISDIEKAKVKVGVVDSIPLALYNCYRYNEYSSKEDCTAIVELGAASTNILIELNGELRYCRNVNIGGNDITEAIAKEFNIAFQQAERIKIQRGIIFPESQESDANEDLVRVSRTIVGVLDQLLGEIKLTVGYFRSLTGATAISRAVLAGGSSMLKNVRPLLADRLGVQVEILNPFKKIAVPKNLIGVKKMAPMFATAVGLSLRSSQDCCQLKISLIPPKIKEEKSRRGRMVLNALSLLFVIGILGLFLWRVIPEAGDRAEEIARLDKEIAKYEEYEEQLQSLKETKALMSEEYKIYSEYPQKAIDVVTPLAVLADSIGSNAWIRYVTMHVTLEEYKESEIVVIDGSIESETKVEGLRQLSNLRLELEKYCEAVNVQGQKEDKTGITFTLNLEGFPTLAKFMELKEQEDKEAVKKEEVPEDKDA
jgi:type IV pilus assembly protein PilM